jgi:Tfp pilus assembly protein PilN
VSGRAGIELTPTAVRLVRLAPFTTRVAQTVEIPWDPSRPLDAVNALRAKVGTVQGIALSIGLGFLEVARLELPPVPALERCRIVELEPDRYFAAANREALAVTVAPDEPIAFGVSSAQLRSWRSAFETWAPVEWIEPAPLSLARSLATNGAATYAIEAAEEEVGVLQVARGRLVSVRRTLDQRAVTDARAIPATAAFPAPFHAGTGVARWRTERGKLAPALAPDEWRRHIASRQRAVLVLNALVAAAALAFAGWSADRWRERTLSALDERVTQVQARGAPADSALQSLRSRDREAQTIRELVATRPDPHAALAAISAALPREATLLSARATGNDWQIDGTTSDAAALVPLLDARPQLDSVRFLSASSRYREGNRSYETFSIALRFRP